MIRNGFILSMVLLLLGNGYSQVKKNQRPVAKSNTPTRCLKTSEQEVLLNVSVWNKEFEFLNELSAENFKISSGKKKQEVSIFCLAGNPERSIGILLDNPLRKIKFPSRSAKGEEFVDLTEKVIGGIKEFLQNDDSGSEYFLVETARQPTLAVDLSRNPKEIEMGLDSFKVDLDIRRAGIFDVLSFGIDKSKKSQIEKRVLLLITSGNRIWGKKNFDQMVKLVRKSEVSIYVINVRYGQRPPPLGTLKRLEKLTVGTGGILFNVDSAETAIKALRIFSEELKNQYTIGFVPKGIDKNNRWKRNKVIVDFSVSEKQKYGKVFVKSNEGFYY